MDNQETHNICIQDTERRQQNKNNTEIQINEQHGYHQRK